MGFDNFIRTEEECVVLPSLGEIPIFAVYFLVVLWLKSILARFDKFPFFLIH